MAETVMPMEDAEMSSAPMAWTAFFTAVALIGPWLVPRGRDRGDLQVYIVMTAISMWVVYMTVYSSQSNPSFGPELTREEIEWMAMKWGRPIKELPAPIIQLDVTIETSSRTLSFFLGDPETSIKELKATIKSRWWSHHKSEVLTYDMILTFKDHILEETEIVIDKKTKKKTLKKKTMKSYKILSGSILKMKYIDIDVDVTIDSNQNSIRATTKGWHSISKLIDIIRAHWITQHEEEVLTESHYLTFKDKPLEDDRRVAQYNILPGSNLLIKTKMIHVKIESDDKSITLVLRPQHTVGALAAKIRETWRREHDEDVLTDDQFLTFNDKPLEDHLRLKDYGLTETGLTLMIKYRDINIVVKYDLRPALSIALAVKPWNIISSVMDAVKDEWKQQHKEDVLTQYHIFTFNEQPLDETSTVEHNQIVSGSTLWVEHMTYPVRVRLPPQGTNLHIYNTVQMKYFETLSDMKAKIYKKTGIPPDDQKFVYSKYHNYRNPDDDKTLQYYGIGPGSLVNVFKDYGNLNLHVKNGDDLLLTFKPSYDIAFMHFRVEAVYNKLKVKLYHNGKLLDDLLKTIEEYNIKNDDIIRVVEDKEGLDELMNLIRNAGGLP